MSESVEQAALRRGRPVDVVADVIEALADNTEATRRIMEVVEKYGKWFTELHAENAELREGMLALSNRIEAVARFTLPRQHPDYPAAS